MSLIFAPSRFKMVRGATWADEVRITDDLNVPINLTGATEIVMRIRREPDSRLFLLELTLANGRITIVNAALGEIAILVSAAATLALPKAAHEVEQYVYDAVIDRGGTPKVIEPAFRGWITVEPQVTRLLIDP